MPLKILTMWTERKLVLKMPGQLPTEQMGKSLTDSHIVREMGAVIKHFSCEGSLSRNSKLYTVCTYTHMHYT